MTTMVMMEELEKQVRREEGKEAENNSGFILHYLTERTGGSLTKFKSNYFLLSEEKKKRHREVQHLYQCRASVTGEMDS